MTTAQMNDPERDGSAAVGIPVDRTVRPRVWMDARWPQWDTADSFVEGDEPLTEHAWVPLYDDEAVQNLRHECWRLREALYRLLHEDMMNDLTGACEQARSALGEWRPNAPLTGRGQGTDR